MFREARQYVRRCDFSQRYKMQQLAPAGHMNPPRILGPWKTVSVDIKSSLTRVKNENAYIIMFQDRLTNWLKNADPYIRQLLS